MDPAVIGAAGVLAGSAITMAGQFLNGEVQWRRERDAAQGREKRALRLSVRLVMEELAEALNLIEKAARSGRYWPMPREMPTGTWSEYRTDLAAAIDGPLDWRILTMAYDAINNLNWTVQHRRFSDQTVDGARLGVWVNPEDNTRQVWRAVRQAIQVLEQTIGVAGPASRMLGEPGDVERQCWPHGDGEDFDVEAARIAEREAQYEVELRESEDW